MILICASRFKMILTNNVFITTIPQKFFLRFHKSAPDHIQRESIRTTCAILAKFQFSFRWSYYRSYLDDADYRDYFTFI